MHTRTKTLLAMALPAALLSPVALAQDQQAQDQQSQQQSQDQQSQDQQTDVHQNATARQPMTPLNSDMSVGTYSHLDKNRDGRVSAEEAAADPSFHTRPKATGATKQHKKQATAEGQMSPPTDTDQMMKDDSTNKDESTSDTPPTPPR
jgi:hypothetical protein